MTTLETQIKRAEGNIERRLNEHTQMQVMLERCKQTLGVLVVFGNLSIGQERETFALGVEIEALLQKVRT